ncbi:YhcN/YlaJ family sporulation lipoprotein [Brevibacillus humidisoli]|uniref:YhcN/YlaJ family sporulation lipoprotein n=1 Tax=Brevibacillus humidisoli TaxID=2895522 RepID=UPI001E522635|nr:YhcN/YlaJ family sporulation lipoprotein [Brevibacillus humidisoli]UFJ43293.1 YhcN/YlaJ family sporulation lipoprotein [Brevibacillus humidisoli]
MVSWLCLTAVVGCSLQLASCATTNESSQSGLHQNIRNTDLYTLGNEKNMLTRIRPLRSVSPIEQDVKRIPGIVDAKLVTVGNTVVIGALIQGQTSKRIYQQSSPIDRNRYTKNSSISDGYNSSIIQTIRPRLAETDYKVIMITTNPLHFSQIAEIRRRQQQGKPVSDSELRRLVNEVGYSTAPYNLVD